MSRRRTAAQRASGCQLCGREPAAHVIETVRFGAACQARITAIATAAGVAYPRAGLGDVFDPAAVRNPTAIPGRSTPKATPRATPRGKARARAKATSADRARPDRGAARPRHYREKQCRRCPTVFQPTGPRSCPACRGARAA